MIRRKPARLTGRSLYQRKNVMSAVHQDVMELLVMGFEGVRPSANAEPAFRARCQRLLFAAECRTWNP